MHFTLTDSSGWTYDGTFALPNVQVVFSKDITNSAPGSAQLRAQVSYPQVPILSFKNTNAGRPNGPTVAPTYFVAYEVSPSLVGPGMPRGFGECSIVGDSGDYEPFPDAVECAIGAGQPGQLGSDQGDLERGSEADVDRFLAGFHPADPTFVINFDRLYRGCNVFLLPSGEVRQAGPVFFVRRTANAHC